MSFSRHAILAYAGYCRGLGRRSGSRRVVASSARMLPTRNPTPRLWASASGSGRTRHPQGRQHDERLMDKAWVARNETRPSLVAPLLGEGPEQEKGGWQTTCARDRV